MENLKVMSNNKYLIKEITPWMMDELIVFSTITEFDIIFLRKQNDFYTEELEQLEKNGVSIHTKPYAFGNMFKKIFTIITFFFRNLTKFKFNYSGVIGFKSIIWFLRLDLSFFGPESNIHAQFATQPSIISLLVKRYYNNAPQYSITFHAYDIYFKNDWFKLLVNNCFKAYSISKYNIEYVNKKYLASDRIVLSRLGVFRELIQNNKRLNKEDSKIFTLGLMTWFDEKKGIIFLMDAMLMLKNKGYDNIRLVLAGDGSLKNEYLEFIQKNDLMDTINYVGRIKREEKQNFFNSLDAFILPSISLKNDQDGIPVVLMEAIAYSLPIISTDVSGIPEICINDFNGHLVHERNVDELVKAIIHLYNNIDNRNKYAKNSFTLSNEYDITLNSKSKIESLGWI